MSQTRIRLVAQVACAAAVAFALRTWAVPAWRRFAEHDAREAELHAG
jgi:hypothetical protein